MDFPSYLDTEFLRPLMQGWMQKLRAAEESKARKEWKEVVDECHDDKTEVLTDHGWKLFSALGDDDFLATVNLDTDTIEFQKPSKITKRLSGGKMIRFSGKTLDALVTTNHRMVYFPAHSQEPGLKCAGDLNRSDQLKLTAANWSGAAPKLPEFLGIVNPLAFAEWIGFYIAEGCCSGSGEGKYPISISQSKPNGRQYYENIVERLPFGPGCHTGKEYKFDSKDLWNYLKPLGDCYSKVVPQWVKDGTQDVIRAFLNGYLAGDGHIADGGQTVSGTASKQLADDIQELWLKIGQSAVIKERPPAPYCFTEPNGETRSGMSGLLYLVTSWKPGKRASLKRHNGSEIELKFGDECYDGMVYCATVPNGTLITRRNGKPLISGNCLMFYNRSANAMWDNGFTRKVWSGVKTPRFRFTTNKAFELVAVFGPNLLWSLPHRQVEPKTPFSLPDHLLQANPQLMQTVQQLMPYQQQSEGEDAIIAHLMQTTLNYFSREQPGGGLTSHAKHSVTDALLTGRGATTSRPYKFPGSDRTLIGSFHTDPRSIYTDPDFPSFHDARWMAIKHVHPYYEVERRFQLEPNSLRNRATLESSWSNSELQTLSDRGAMERQAGRTSDLIVWYEIYSKSGAGAMQSDMMTPIKSHLEETVGQYAYIAISPNVPYPLNCPAKDLRSKSDEEVKQRFAWPVELWRDSRWPTEVCDFYIDPDSPYPVPPLAPGLGELKFLNFMLPWLANRIYTSSRDFWAVAGPHVQHYTNYLQTSIDQNIIPTPTMVDDVRKAITVLQQPETRLDAWRIFDLVSDRFDKAVGLTEHAYGNNTGGTQDRTAETTQARNRAVGVRPEHMQNCVVDWQSNVAGLEGIMARRFCKGKDLQPLLGPLGSTMWDKYVSSTDFERSTRQMSFTVAASSIRRPNRDKAANNFTILLNTFAGILQSYSEATGDYEPVNALMRKFGELNDFSVDEFNMTPPEPDPQQQQMEEQQQQMEMQKLQVELQKMSMELQGKQLDAQSKQQQMQIQGQSQVQNLQIDQAKFSQDHEQDQVQHLLSMVQDHQKHRQAMRFAGQKHRASLKQQKESAAAKAKMQARKPTGSAA